MSEQTPHPLRFICTNCGRESIYPNTLQQDDQNKGVRTLLKRCTHCGTENKVVIPVGWSADRPDVLFRGHPKDD